MPETNLDKMIAAKFATVCSLHGLGVRMMEQNLLRKHPTKSSPEIRGMVLEWLGHKPTTMRALPVSAARRKRVEAA